MMSARKKRDPVEDRWMSLPQAAAAIGCSRQGVLISIAKGDLRSEQVAGRIVVSRDSVDSLIARRTAASV